MADVKKTARRTTAERIVRKLSIRNMTGHYRDAAAEAVELARELVEPAKAPPGAAASRFPKAASRRRWRPTAIP